MEQGRAREDVASQARARVRVPQQARGEFPPDAVRAAAAGPAGARGAVPPPAGRHDEVRDTGPGTPGAADSLPEPGPARPADPARGEHVHSEPPAPRLVQRHSVRGQVLDALRTALVSGDLVPGEVYSAPALGERLGVSATPVREAMQQLAVEGAVEVVPNRGFRVVRRTPRELAELAEVRALIEVPVMLRLARSEPAARWDELRPLAEATVAAAARGDRARYAEADRAFHRAVLRLAGNEQLVAVAEDLHRRSQWPLVSAPVARRADLVADAAEHTALLDALAAQDLPVVQSLVREHFTGARG
ncbi:GntR family transcriptional regulator [Streptomyces sp. NPDC001941]|uniref:GntR family transcriptional regulator n=1 Tax=Streptomyces sp. NPDC001941 TaxID=3154659 RepID=UPI003318C61B